MKTKDKVGEGMKFDDDKLMWDLLPYDTIESVVDILTYGAKKYSPNNWQNVSLNRYEAAMMRHYVAWRKGEVYDPESGKHHLSHALCNMMFMLWKEVHQNGETYKQGDKACKQ